MLAREKVLTEEKWERQASTPGQFEEKRKEEEEERQQQGEHGGDGAEGLAREESGLGEGERGGRCKGCGTSTDDASGLCDECDLDALLKARKAMSEPSGMGRSLEEAQRQDERSTSPTQQQQVKAMAWLFMYFGFFMLLADLHDWVVWVLFAFSIGAAVALWKNHAVILSLVFDAATLPIQLLYARLTK